MEKKGNLRIEKTIYLTWKWWKNDPFYFIKLHKQISLNMTSLESICLSYTYLKNIAFTMEYYLPTNGRSTDIHYSMNEAKDIIYIPTYIHIIHSTV